jgi:hypothetical protein
MCTRAPGKGFLLTFMWATTSLPGSTRSTKQFQFATGVFFAKQPGFDDLSVIEHHQVSRVYQVGQVSEHAVSRGVRAAVQQAGATALSCRVLGNQFGGQVKVKIGQRMGGVRLVGEQKGVDGHGA